jgi:hypothetical protein
MGPHNEEVRHKRKLLHWLRFGGDVVEQVRNNNPFCQEVIMNFSKKRLQGFVSGTPAYVLIHGLLRLCDGKNFATSYEGIGNATAAFRAAAFEIGLGRHKQPHMNPAWHYARPIPRELYDDLVKAESIGHVHLLIHHALDACDYTDTHVNTCSAQKLAVLERELLRELRMILPADPEHNLLLITARSPESERMVLLTK